MIVLSSRANSIQVHLPIDTRSGKNKGFAHIQYTEPAAATKALQTLDRKPFQGRLLHLMPADARRENTLDEFSTSKLPLKRQQEIKRKANAASSTFNWNSMYMNVSTRWRMKLVVIAHKCVLA